MSSGSGFWGSFHMRPAPVSAASQLVHLGIEAPGEVLFVELLDVATNLVRIELHLFEPVERLGDGLRFRLVEVDAGQTFVDRVQEPTPAHCDSRSSAHTG